MLEALYVYRVDSLFALLGIESYSVVLLDLQTIQTCYMHEEIFIRFVLSNEAETF